MHAGKPLAHSPSETRHVVHRHESAALASITAGLDVIAARAEVLATPALELDGLTRGAGPRITHHPQPHPPPQQPPPEAGAAERPPAAPMVSKRTVSMCPAGQADGAEDSSIGRSTT